MKRTSLISIFVIKGFIYDTTAILNFIVLIGIAGFPGYTYVATGYDYNRMNTPKLGVTLRDTYRCNIW